MATRQKSDLPHREQLRSRRAGLLRETDAAHPTAQRASASPQRTGAIWRAIYVTLAGFFFIVAALGAMLPGLPCTPFLLLTSFFLLRSWPAMNDRLSRSRWFGPILRDWQERGGVARHVKVKSILIVALVVGATLYFGGLSPWLQGIVSVLSLVGIGVVARLPEPRR